MQYIRYIVTRQNADGTYDEVGMSNRTIVSGYKTWAGALRYAIKPFGRGVTVRVEAFPSNLHTDPVKIFYVAC
jgi:hypothetical protein